MHMRFEVWKLPMSDPDPSIKHVFTTRFIRLANTVCKVMNYWQKSHRYFLTCRILYEDSPVMDPSKKGG